MLAEAERQVRPDGVYFEQSLYYHVYALDFFLHTRALAACNGNCRVGEASMRFWAGCWKWCACSAAMGRRRGLAMMMAGGCSIRSGIARRI